MRPRAASLNEVPQSSAYRGKRGGKMVCGEKDEDGSVGPEHEVGNLTNDYVDKFGSALACLKSV